MILFTTGFICWYPRQLKLMVYLTAEKLSSLFSGLRASILLDTNRKFSRNFYVCCLFDLQLIMSIIGHFSFVL